MAGAKTVSVVVKRTKRFADGNDIEVSLAEFGVYEKEQALVFMYLCERCDELLQMYIKNVPALAINASGAGGLPFVEPTSKQWFVATEICVNMKDGKRLYKVKGGQFSEHGVNFWPEHMKIAGIEPGNIPDEGYKFKQPTWMEVEYERGQPKRVLSLTKEKP